MRVEIKGLDKLQNKLNVLPKILEDAVFSATTELVEDIQGRIESKLQSSIKYNNGGLAGSFKNEVVKEKDGVVGRNFSDDIVATIRELGSGLVGQESQKDLPEGINPQYTQTPWFFPSDSVDLDLTAIYGMPKITIQGKEFYRTNGQPARPYMYPAFKEGVEHADEVFKEHVQRHLKKGLR